MLKQREITYGKNKIKLVRL